MATAVEISQAATFLQRDPARWVFEPREVLHEHDRRPGDMTIEPDTDDEPLDLTDWPLASAIIMARQRVLDAAKKVEAAYNGLSAAEKKFVTPQRGRR